MISNSIAEILGRKRSLMIDCVAFLLGYSLYATGVNVATLCIARAFLGYPLVNTVGIFEAKCTMIFCLTQTSLGFPLGAYKR